jgi:YegS/Rv2252/BmrU family lipid kinase
VRAAIIINPISGTGTRSDTGRVRAELAAAVATARGVEADIIVTERPGHARELSLAALGRGVSLVIAWGGDGTVNEVASALAFRETAALGIIPSGSGNGLARELGLPLEPAAALGVALTGRSRVIDCGELDGHLFFNVAGLGLDARVAHQFAAHGRLRRGFRTYLRIATRELLRYRADEHVIRADGQQMRVRALIVAIANGRQYGNGAVIAPDAQLDDGRLDVVIVEDRPVWRTLARVPDLFAGRIARIPGVFTCVAETVAVASAQHTLYHVDGEPFVGRSTIEGRVRPRALTVRVLQR